VQDLIENFQNLDVIRLTKNPMYGSALFYDPDDEDFDDEFPLARIRVQNLAV
jgi:hypothetical protein